MKNREKIGRVVKLSDLDNDRLAFLAREIVAREAEYEAILSRYLGTNVRICRACPRAESEGREAEPPPVEILEEIYFEYDGHCGLHDPVAHTCYEIPCRAT